MFIYVWITFLIFPNNISVFKDVKSSITSLLVKILEEHDHLFNDHAQQFHVSKQVPTCIHHWFHQHWNHF